MIGGFTDSGRTVAPGKASSSHRSQRTYRDDPNADALAVIKFSGRQHESSRKHESSRHESSRQHESSRKPTSMRGSSAGLSGLYTPPSPSGTKHSSSRSVLKSSRLGLTVVPVSSSTIKPSPLRQSSRAPTTYEFDAQLTLPDMSRLSLAEKSRTGTLRKEGGTPRSVHDALLPQTLQKMASRVAVSARGPREIEQVEERKGGKHVKRMFFYEEQVYNHN